MKWRFWRKPIPATAADWKPWVLNQISHPFFGLPFVKHVQREFTDEDYARSYQAKIKKAGYDAWIGRGCSPNPFWTFTTRVFQARANFTCEHCGRRVSLQIHHQDTERTLGIELLFPELMSVLCPRDHEAISMKPIVMRFQRENVAVQQALTGQVMEVAAKNAELERVVTDLSQKMDDLFKKK
jgi:hypothetical protein